MRLHGSQAELVDDGCEVLGSRLTIVNSHLLAAQDNRDGRLILVMELAEVRCLGTDIAIRISEQ